MARPARPAAGTGIKSAERTLAVLEYFQARRRAATVGEIAAALRLPQSSTSVLLRCLAGLGYLDYRAETRSFHPTYRVALLGGWIQRGLFEGGALTDTMEALREELGETVVLGARSGASMRYVHIVEAHHAVRLAIQVGTLRPMTRTALGRILLSREPDHRIRAIARRNNADALDKAHRVGEREFMREIETIRRQGFAESGGRMTPDASTIAVLVPVEAGATPLAIGVGGPMDRIAERRDTILAALRRRFAG